MSPVSPTTTIVDCSGVGPGGITRVLTEVVRHWPAGHRLRVVAAPADWQPPGTVADVTIEGRHRAGRAGTIASAALALRRATAAGDRATTTRVLSMSPSAAVAGSRLPVTTVVHDLAFKLWPHGLSASVRRYRQVSYAMAVRRSARLLCVSARTQHDLFGVYGVPYARTRVWHPGSDLSVAGGTLPAPLDEIHRRGGRYLVIAGHAAHKGVELAIEAMSDAPGFVLAVLTGGQRVGRFEDEAARSPAAGRIVFLPRLTDEQYAATVQGAAAFLMPSHFEGYGLPAAEALRLGTPAVVSPDPALHEATRVGAVRMDSWTAGALTRALAEIDRPARRTGLPDRSWADATAHLFALVAEEPVPRRTPPVPVGTS